MILGMHSIKPARYGFFDGATLRGCSPAEPLMPYATNRKNTFFYHSHCKGTAFLPHDQILGAIFDNFNIIIKNC